MCPTAVPPEDPASYYSVADRLTRETPNAFRPDQYSNPHNPEEHERSTGPEIWRQTNGRITHFVAGVGTGGTVTGVARYLKRMNPDVQIIGADPEGSVYSGGTGRPYLTEGVGEDFWPTTYDPSLVDRVVMVTDAEAFDMTRRVTREEGLLVGGSCGMAVHAALVVGREAGPDAVVVVLLPDSGRGYLSKIFNEEWMMDFGFIRCDDPCAGDVLASKDGSIPDLVLVTPDETARDAWSLMRELGVSQVVVSVSKEPPLAAKEVSGTLDELSLMDLGFRDPSVLERPVSEIMSPAIPMIGIGEPIPEVVDRLEPRVGGARPRRRSSRRHPQPLGPALVPRGQGARMSRDASGEGPGFETRAIHAGQDADPRTGAVVVPIQLATTFAQDAVGKHRGFEYGRSGNPTRAALETCLASLEGARTRPRVREWVGRGRCRAARAPRTGGPRRHSDDAYGGTFRLVAKVLGATGVSWSSTALSTPDALRDVWTEATKVVWVETPTNPALGIVDIAAVADVVHELGAILVVDNTFATPYLQRPIELGADVVVHSTTKYLGGHSDVVGGFVGVADDELGERIAFLQNAAGGVPSPFDCYLVLRGIKTLGVRMDRHCTNARAVAEMLDAHPAVARVLYPGLPKHPGHGVAARQMRGFGGMVSFLAAGGEGAALDLVARTRVFTLAESLGAVESLIEHPARHDPRLSRGLAARRRSGAGAPLGRDRVPRRPPRRPGASPGLTGPPRARPAGRRQRSRGRPPEILGGKSVSSNRCWS